MGLDYLFTHILQDYFTGTGAILWLPQCQLSNLEGYEYSIPATYHNKKHDFLI